MGATARTVETDSPLARGALRGGFCHRPQFQSQRVQSDETGRIALVERRRVAFHCCDPWIIKALRAFPASNDDVALVKLETHNARDVALRFYNQRLERFAFRREPKAVANELAVFCNEGVARVHSH
jgi:hypothetical protein